MSKVSDEEYERAVQQALQKLDPEIRQIAKKYTMRAKVEADVKAGTVGKTAIKMADEMMAVVMKRHTCRYRKVVVGWKGVIK